MLLTAHVRRYVLHTVSPSSCLQPRNISPSRSTSQAVVVILREQSYVRMVLNEGQSQRMSGNLLFRLVLPVSWGTRPPGVRILPNSSAVAHNLMASLRIGTQYSTLVLPRASPSSPVSTWWEFRSVSRRLSLTMLA